MAINKYTKSAYLLLKKGLEKSLMNDPGLFADKIATYEDLE